MSRALRHRGPDDCGVYLSDGVGLAHRRLAILDLTTRGRQPMTSPDGRATIVYNGEVYNFRDLRADLAARGHTFRSETDTEVLLNGYLEYGTGCFRQFRGMFAIAIWDRDTRTLLAARDRLGKKPFYYWHDGGRFVFSSELQALSRVPGVPRQLDAIALSQYLALQYVPVPRTGLADCRKLPPGHYLTFALDDGRVSVQRYWHLERIEANEPGSLDRISETERLLRDSVRLRMISDVEVGVLLSGGVDSSLVAALAARESTTPIKTFGVSFPDSTLDESRYARRVASMLGTEHHQVDAERMSPDDLSTVLAHVDEPLGDPACVPTYFVAKHAARHVKVVLTGEGADELFAGYPHYVHEHRTRWMWTLPAALRQSLGMLLTTLVPSAAWSRGLMRLGRVWQSPRTLGVTRWVSVFGPKEFGRLTSAEFRNAVVGSDVWAPIADLFLNSEKTTLVERGMSADLQSWLPEDLLMKVDKMSMACSLEARPPFLDHHLVQYVHQQNLCHKLRGGETKLLLKAVAARYLPQEIVTRRKHGFEVPIVRWLCGPFHDLAEEMFSVESLRHSGVFASGEVHRAWVAMKKSEKTWNPRAMWLMFILANWMRLNRAHM